MEQAAAFVQQVYLVDLAALAARYADWLPLGKGVTNYVAVPDRPLDRAGTVFNLPGGTIFDGNLWAVREIKGFDDPYFRDNVSESIARAWYDGDRDRHPWDEDTVPREEPVGETDEREGRDGAGLQGGRVRCPQA